MKIVVLAGGISPERDVSISSACKISNALRNKGHQVILVDLFLGIEEVGNEVFKGKDSDVVNKYVIPDCPPDLIAIKEKRADKSDSLFGPNVLEMCKLADLVFIALHGAAGEDGRVQAALDVHGIKYTGSSYLACGIAMDKELTKRLLKPAGVPMADGILINEDTTVEEIVKITGLPCIIKPCNCGSSVGVSIASTREELQKAIDFAEYYDGKVIVEKYIKGREFSVGVLMNEALPPIEIIPKMGFYDYKNKYQANSTDEICPAEIDETETNILKRLALKVHKEIGLGSYSRSDFIRTRYGEFVFLEVNTLPGMTPASLLPQEAQAVGIDYETLCETIVNAIN